jgi:dipeptidase E
MKLFLASEAKHPDSFKKLEDFVGGFAGKKVAYIPSAANGMGWESWKGGGSWNLVNSLDVKLDNIILEDYGNESVVERILRNDVVWFAGGMVGYLLYWMKRCSIDKNIHKILDKMVYIGSSAGSMVLCNSSNEMVTWEFVDNEIGADEIKPLKFFDFDIYPHYEEKFLDEIEKRYKGKKLYLLKNGEALIVDGNKLEVFGEERIITNE